VNTYVEVAEVNTLLK